MNIQDCKNEQSDTPLNLTIEAENKYPGAVMLARTLLADRASLEPIRKYLIRKEQLGSEQVDHAITEYVKYLVMIGATNMGIAPSEEADSVWHAHILHAHIYEPFCRRHFGRFIHHVPSDPDAHADERVLQSQNELGKLFFGKNTIYCSHHGCNNHHSCFGHGCRPGMCSSGPSH